MRFEVFKDGKIVKNFPLCGAYLFGTDSIPLRTAGQIKFNNGVIEYNKKNNEPAGLALLWPIEGFGKILLPTTRLPERQRPYNLNVELARAKLMQITIKREDWSFFEETNSLSNAAKLPQDLFIQSLQNIGQPSRASVLADESLKKAVVFSEKLTEEQAKTFFDARCKNRTLGKGSLGCQIEPEKITETDYAARLGKLFGFVTIPINWAQIQTHRANYDFEMVDRCIDVFGRKKLAISAGPLLCFSKDYLPRWLLAGKPSFEKIREASYEFVSKIVTRYAKYVYAWRVISGINAMNHFGFGFEQVLEMTRAATLAAKAADNRSLKLIEITYPWGEYYASEADTIPPLVYMDMVVQSGISFDAFGVQMQFGKNQPGMHIRDMMQVSAMLDRFAPVDKPLHITSVAVPSATSSGLQACEVAGMWHKGWDQQVQAEWVEQFYKIALSKPYINSVTYSSFADRQSPRNSTIAEAGLLTDKLEPKKSFQVLTKLQKLILNR